MCRSFALAVLFLSGTLSCLSQTLKPEDWQGLIDANKCEEARRLCAPFEESPLQRLQQAEAEKCMSNVALCGHSVVQIQAEKNHEVSLSDGGYDPKSVDEALIHLNKGIELAPQDLSIHQGRLHVLEISGRYKEMVAALGQSCDIYKGKEALQAWLAYAPELYQLREINTAIAFMKVLDNHYPDSSDVLGNLGAFLDASGKPQEGIPYLERAVHLSPSDEINTWDLAIAYEHGGRVELADEWYRKGLGLTQDEEDKKFKACAYGHFAEEKLKDLKRACELESNNCSKDNQPACKRGKTSVAN